MQDIEIRNLWKSYDNKLERVLSFNQQLVADITKTKAKSILSNAKPMKYAGIIIGIPWVLLLDAICVIGWLSGGIFFTISIGIISLVTKIAIGTYIYHLILIRQINISDSVVEAQEKLAQIKSSSIDILRVVLLQLPFWATFHLRLDILLEPNIFYWIANGIIISSFTFVTIWLWRNIKLENMDKKWMRIFFSGSEWEAVERAKDLLDQIEDYKNPDTTA